MTASSSVSSLRELGRINPVEKAKDFELKRILIVTQFTKRYYRSDGGIGEAAREIRRAD